MTSTASSDTDRLHKLLAYFYDCERARAHGSRLDDVFSNRDQILVPLEPSELQPLSDGVVELQHPSAQQAVLKHQVSPDDQPLSLGLVWIDGSVNVRGRTLRVCAPLLVAELSGRVERSTARVELTSDLALNTSLVSRLLAIDENDDDVAQHLLSELLELTPDLPFTDNEMSAFLDALSRLDISVSVPPVWEGLESPVVETFRRSEAAEVRPYAALFLGRASSGVSISDDLAAILEAELEGTALEAVYDLPQMLENGDDGNGGDWSAQSNNWHPNLEVLPLTERQKEIRNSTRYAPLTVVTGPPGTGKSYTISALVLDHLLAGRRVLITSGTDKAVENVVESLRRIAGDSVVAFSGNKARKKDLANVLGTILGSRSGAIPYSTEEIARQVDRYSDMKREVDRLDDLALEVLAREGSAAFADAVMKWNADLVEKFELAEVDNQADDLEDLVGRSHVHPDAGFWKRAGAQRALKKARQRTRQKSADFDDDLDRVPTYVRAREELAVLTNELSGDRTTARAFAGLSEMRRHLHQQAALVVGMKRAAALALVLRDPVKKQALSDFKKALTSTKARERNALLAGVPTELPLEIFPCWAVTSDHIAHALPAIPAMFDLVVVDEASTVALSSSAPSLFRAKRAVVVGDPMQLRFVSMLSNAAQQVSIARHQISQRDQIRYKVSSTSLYDAAADAAPDQFMFLLDEHFRCAPEIIRFSNEQFYGKELRIMTERPSIDLPDSIEIRSVAGRRTDDTSGPNLLEVAEAVAVVASIITESKDLENPPSIGLLSPFRDQANALNCALVESFTPDEIARHRITCGTAHSLQGDERAIVVLSTCLDPNYASNQLAFLEKNELFNVAITRAQRKLIVISSIAEHPIGRDRLWAKFLAHVRSAAPTSGQSDRFDSLFESEVCAALRAQGFTVHTQFPSCGYFIDLVATKGSRQIAVECDGPTHFRTDGTYTDEDLIRHLTLERAGWQIIRLPYTEWMSDPLRAVERVVAALEREPSRFQPAPPALPAASASMAPTASRGRDLVRREPGKRAAKPPRAPRGSTACSCGGKWVLRKGKYGEFYGCSKFPDCRQTRQM